MFDGSCITACRRRDGQARETGAVAVEFAMVLPILIMLLIGTITTGVSYSHALGVTNAVREGARFGATADASSGSWTTDVIARVRATQFDDFGSPLKETSVCVQLWKSGTGAVKSDCDAAGGPGDASPGGDLDSFPIPALPTGVCVVRVVASRYFEIKAPPLLPPLGRKKMLRGSVARYERTSC